MTTLTQPTTRAAAPQVTADELLDMLDDGFRYELVRGEVRKMAPPGYFHGKVSNRAGWRLTTHVETNDLGVVTSELGFLLSRKPDTVRAPDAAFIRWERIDEVGEVEGYWPGVPDLVMEVISPNDRYTQVNEKVSEWLSAGVRMVVVIDYRRREVVVHRPAQGSVTLGEDDVLDGGDVVPGWRMPIRDMFVRRRSGRGG